MFSLLTEFTQNLTQPLTIIVMDEEAIEQPRRYQVVPRTLWFAVGGGALALVLLTILAFTLTPLRGLMSRQDTALLQQEAQINALRIAAMQDSLAMQQQYMRQIRGVMTGQIDSTLMAFNEQPDVAPSVSGELAAVAAEPRSEDWGDHEQPALPVAKLTVDSGPSVRMVRTSAPYASMLTLPAQPPVNGLLTRGFDARTGHFAIDIAVETGTMVRSIGAGYVIFADWTHDGGYAIAVQHADGYVSVYKHNQRLLKRAGERVREREPVAVSGNSGEITTGPHLHFELWRDGLAQDPSSYLVDW